MEEPSPQLVYSVEVVAYDPRWPNIYAAERDAILVASRGHFVAFEHIGSTAVPGQRAKPIIDMMAAVPHLEDSEDLIALLHALGYHVHETGMRNRVFLPKHDPHTEQVFHLHIVEHATWDERKERLMRDYLQAHPDAMHAYGTLKDTLAATHAHDSLAYTKAKTAFIQALMDHARTERGLPPADVWED